MHLLNSLQDLELHALTASLFNFKAVRVNSAKFGLHAAIMYFAHGMKYV